MSKKYLMAAALSAGLLAASVASATVSTTGGTRTFTFDSKTFFSPGYDHNSDWVQLTGDGNINATDKNPLGPEWEVYVNNDDGKPDATVNEFTVTGDGKFSISSNIWNVNNWYDYLIALKVGEKKGLSPDWVIFGVEAFAKSGVWTVDPDQGGGLSHWMVYRQEGVPPQEFVPIPGAAWMMLTGLVGFMGIARKRSAVSA